MAEDLKVLQGIDTVVFVRKLDNAKNEPGKLLPYQTSAKFDPSKKVDSTATKDGMVTTNASVETDFEVEFINSTSAIADQLYDSLFGDEMLEVWLVSRKRKNAEGKYYGWYMHAKVTEDENDNDADDNSTRDATFTVEGTPQRGWTTLPKEAQDQINYIFKGIDKDDGKGGDGGSAWTSQDESEGTPALNAPASK